MSRDYFPDRKDYFRAGSYRYLKYRGWYVLLWVVMPKTYKCYMCGRQLTDNNQIGESNTGVICPDCTQREKTPVVTYFEGVEQDKPEV